MRSFVGLLIVFACLLSAQVQAFEFENSKIGAYLDAQYLWSDQADGSSFLLKEGALTIERQVVRGKFYVDLPIIGGLKKDADSGNFENDIEFGDEQAQAYVAWSFDGGLEIKAGQFDRYIGLVKNDSAEQFLQIALFGCRMWRCFILLRIRGLLSSMRLVRIFM